LHGENNIEPDLVSRMASIQRKAEESQRLGDDSSSRVGTTASRPARSPLSSSPSASWTKSP
jgi:hypothetical protein